ncbi:unnamed protein product [Dicrocoelium dendriticum]|nr:unnamed protein product [Dicrocoelium dendriticum]
MSGYDLTSLPTVEQVTSMKSPYYNAHSCPPSNFDASFNTGRSFSNTASFNASTNGPYSSGCPSQIIHPDIDTGVSSCRSTCHSNHQPIASHADHQFPTAMQPVAQPTFPHRYAPSSPASNVSTPTHPSNVPPQFEQSTISHSLSSPGTFTVAVPYPYVNPGGFPTSYDAQSALNCAPAYQASRNHLANSSQAPDGHFNSVHFPSPGVLDNNAPAVPPTNTTSSSQSFSAQPSNEPNFANTATVAHSTGIRPMLYDQQTTPKTHSSSAQKLAQFASHPRAPPIPHSFSAPHPAPVDPSMHSTSGGSIKHSVQPPLVQPFTPASRHSSDYRRQPTSEASTFFRSPGTPATRAEWNRIKNPIGLLQEHNLMPSDSADLPPKPTISFPVNCDPDIMRCTLPGFPATAKLLAQCRLPLGLVMHPFRDLSRLHTINSTVIVRCRSCRTYINPFVQFVDSGRRWRCPICFLSNSVPDDFFYDPGTQTYGDPARRPEIRSATVEFIAPPEYMLRPPQSATYLFCLDVSRNAIATGYLNVVCERLATHLLRMPGDSRRQIGLITYDSAIHFYKLCGDSMKMLICPDLDEPFIPEYEGLLNLITESSETLVEFLTYLPDSFAESSDVGNCLGSVLQVALKLIGSTGGRITVFNTCLPNLGAGCLRMREEQSDRTSADVKSLGPAIDFYKTFALDCAAQQVAVDLFLLNSQYCDIATLSGAARFSSGGVYHYPDFYCPPRTTSGLSTTSSKVHAEAESRSVHNAASLTTQQPNTQSVNSTITLECFRRDFDRYLSRKIGFEAVMRIRCTHGLSIQAFHGSFFVRSTDLMSLPNVNPDAGFAVQLGISESVEKLSTVCCQTAILYTSSKGDRRIRVHTLCLPVVHTPSEVFLGADQGAIACLIGKMAVDRAINTSLVNAREALANALADFLSAYASSIGITSDVSISSYYMACPPSLRLLPLYLCGLLRHTAFRVGVPVRIDDRSAALERLKSAPPEEMLTLLYPRLYAVHNFVSKPVVSDNATLARRAAALCLSDYGDALLDATHHSTDDSDSSSSNVSDFLYDAGQLPGQLHLSARSISRSGVYLLDTGEIIFLLIGSQEDSASGAAASSEMVHQLLGVPIPNSVIFSLPPIVVTNGKSDVPIGLRRLSALVNLLRQRRPLSNALVCICHDAPASLRTRFISTLIEDRTEYAPSYQEFLQMVQSIMKG